MRYSFDIYSGAVRKLQEDDYSQLVICFIGAHELSRREVGIGYYAFGLRHSVTGRTNNYLYNGKELQDELGQYDYSFAVYGFNGIHELGGASVMGRGSMIRLWGGGTWLIRWRRK